MADKGAFMSNLKEGDVAPDFSATNQKGQPVKLSQYKGKNVVLYFYPKDDTPGCTIEAKEFTEMAGKFAGANTVVLGVSYDDAACHQAFIDKYGLKIDLLTDVNKSIAQSYGSFGDKYPSRDTFLIDGQGKIKKIFRGVKPQGHASEVLAAFQ
jgi:peroxiredoxin Q/BCP